MAILILKCTERAGSKKIRGTVPTSLRLAFTEHFVPATQAFDWSIDQVQIQACIHPSYCWTRFLRDVCKSSLFTTSTRICVSSCQRIEKVTVASLCCCILSRTVSRVMCTRQYYFPRKSENRVMNVCLYKGCTPKKK